MSIKCVKCKEEIKSKEDLVVSSLILLILPFHSSCFAKQKTDSFAGMFYRGPINSMIYSIITAIIIFGFSMLTFSTFITMNQAGKNSLPTLIVQLIILLVVAYPRIISFIFFESKLKNKKETVKYESISKQVHNSSQDNVICKVCQTPITKVSDLSISYKIVSWDVFSFHNKCFSNEIKKGVKYSAIPINSPEFFLKYNLKYLILAIISGIIGIGIVGFGILQIIIEIIKPNPYWQDIVSSLIRSLFGGALTGLISYHSAGSYLNFTNKRKAIVDKFDKK